VVAVGDDDRVVLERVAGGDADLEDAVVAARHMLDAGLEADAVAEAEVVDVVVEVLGDVVVAREVRIRLGHREVRVLHARPRRVDVQRAVRGRDVVLVAPDPVAPDAVGQLVAVERDAALVERLGGGDAARPGADQADLGQVGGAHGSMIVARRRFDQVSPHVFRG
jgi:hypothetical protein